MGCAGDGMLVVRSDLCERLDALEARLDRTSVRDLLSGIEAIRTLASAYGLEAVAILAGALERAVRAEPRGCPAGLYLDRLRDAVGCERLDAKASEALLASVSIRLQV